MPPGFEDAAFERYVDLSLIAEALGAGDPVLLTDIALQIAEGERVLLRSHQSKITADSVFEKAAKLAANRQDKVTLERIDKAASKLNKQDLAVQVAGFRKLEGTSRVTDAAFTFSLEFDDIDVIARVKQIHDAIREAQLLEDRDGLEGLKELVADAADIGDERRDALAKQIAVAEESITDGESDTDRALRQLAGQSRSGWLSRATGGRVTTPKAIQRLDPTRRRPVEEGSGLAVYNPQRIDDQGNVWSATGSTLETSQIIARAEIKYDQTGRLAYWVHGALSKRAPQHDRSSPLPPSNASIRNQWHAPVIFDFSTNGNSGTHTLQPGQHVNAPHLTSIQFSNAQGAWRRHTLEGGRQYTFRAAGSAVELAQ